MSQATDYLEDAVINHVLRGIAYASPGTIELALFTANPGETGSVVNEVAGGGYGRATVTFDVPAASSIDLAATATFGNMPATTVTHWAFCEPAAGNLLVYGPFAASHTLLAGQSFDVEAGMASITLAGDGTDPFYEDLLNHIFRNVVYASPGTLDLRLFTADPGVTGALTNEVAGGGYAAQSCPFDAPASGISENSDDEIFSNMPATTVAYWGLSHPVSNELIIRGAYDASIPVAGGENFRQGINTLEVQVL